MVCGYHYKEAVSKAHRPAQKKCRIKAVLCFELTAY